MLWCAPLALACALEARQPSGERERQREGRTEARKRRVDEGVWASVCAAAVGWRGGLAQQLLRFERVECSKSTLVLLQACVTTGCSKGKTTCRGVESD